MSSTILSGRDIPELQPAFALRKLADPAKAEFRFQATNRADAIKWQKRTHAALKNLLLPQLPPASLSPKRIERVEKNGYVREKILLRTSKWTAMPVYVLIPDSRQRPLPTVIAFHGHGYGVKDIVGLWENGAERDTPDGYHADFAIELCKRGFVVAAPEISCFGERQTVFDNPKAPGTCTHTAALAFHLGISALGLRVHDALRLVDYLETRKECDVSRLGAMGISGGGMHTFFSTCLDERIRTCVASGYFCTFRDSIFGVNHCMCNYAPGLYQFGEMSDLAGLIAPRPMLVEAGDHDLIFPIRAVREAVRKAQSVYRAFAVPGFPKTDYFEGRHRINGRKAYPFLESTLQ